MKLITFIIAHKLTDKQSAGKHDIIEVPHRQMRAELRSPVKVGAVSYGGQHLSRDQVHDWLNSPDGRNEVSLSNTRIYPQRCDVLNMIKT